jgi:hypothetical protein
MTRSDRDRKRDQAIIDAWVAKEGADPEKGRIFFERFHELLQRLEYEEMTLAEAAKFMKVPYPVFRRIWAVRLARENVGRL